jgi:hypothetical protein
MIYVFERSGVVVRNGIPESCKESTRAAVYRFYKSSMTNGHSSSPKVSMGITSLPAAMLAATAVTEIVWMLLCRRGAGCAVGLGGDRPNAEMKVRAEQEG